MKKILMIATGGTIASKEGDSGLAPAISGEELADSVPGIRDICQLTVLQLMNIDSTNMRPRQWLQIRDAIMEQYDSYDGFVILHGTDTMAYTASALSFILQNLSKPVILTGSQIPLGEIRSDAKDNLIASMMIAASGKVFEVCLYFAGKLIRGNRAIKMSADSFIAFDSPNYPHLAEAGIDIKYRDSVLMKKSDKPCVLKELNEEPVGVLKIFPGIQIELFEQIITEKLRGVVLETFGAGNVPNYCSALTNIIQKAYENGTIVVVCSQCPTGTVSLGTYAASSCLKRAGAVSGKNMTTEAAVAKLYYLFSCGYSKNKIKELMEVNLCGELDE